MEQKYLWEGNRGKQWKKSQQRQLSGLFDNKFPLLSMYLQCKYSRGFPEYLMRFLRMEDFVEEQKTELKLIRMSEIESQEIEWLWYPFVPYGKLTIIQR